MNALEIQQLTKVFGNQVKALDEVSFTLPEKHIGALIGPSGSGKTTLLRCIAGLEQADEGSISILSTRVFGRQTSIGPSKRQVGFLFQDYALFPHMSVEANVRFGISKLSTSVQKERIHKYLSLCSVDQLFKRYPHELSGGQQQRVALARALAAEPGLLLLDEPFSNVDETLKQQLRLEMAEVIRVCGISALMVVHDVKDAFAIASHIGVLADGRLHQSGTPEQLYNAPQTVEVGKVTGEINVVPAKAAAGGFDCFLGFVKANHSRAQGDSVTLMIRPENLKVKKGKDWKVDSVFFGGSTQMLRCRKGLYSFDVKIEAPNSFSVGEEVDIESIAGVVSASS